MNFIENYLAVTEFSDYCPNGLQVEGTQSIKRVVTGVTACQALLDVAVAKQADLIIVHHGYFWKGALKRTTNSLKASFTLREKH